MSKPALPSLLFASLVDSIFNKKNQDLLEKKLLPAYLLGCRWFGEKALGIVRVVIDEIIEMPIESKVRAYYLSLKVTCQGKEGTPEYYALPITYTFEDANAIREDYSKAVIGSIELGDETGVVYDAIYSREFREALFNRLVEGHKLETKDGTMLFSPSDRLVREFKEKGVRLTSRVLNVEQSNSSIVYNEKYFLKMYRRLSHIVNPEVEINAFFSNCTDYNNVPLFGGFIELQESIKEPISIAMIQERVENKGDAWEWVLCEIGDYFDRALYEIRDRRIAPAVRNSYHLTFGEIPEILQFLIGHGVYRKVRRLATRTAEMHLALGSRDDLDDFAPEDFTMDYQQSVCSSLLADNETRFALLSEVIPKIAKTARAGTERVLEMRQLIEACYREISKTPIEAKRTRIHGDYHLGQVLCTDDDFVIIDFEGEPAAPISQRRLKYSPMKDLAGMVRSFHYASFATLFQNEKYTPKEREFLSKWAEVWCQCVVGFFVKTYQEKMKNSQLIPSEKEVFNTLFQVYLMDKAVYELCYELNNRPHWSAIPFRGIVQVIKHYIDGV